MHDEVALENCPRKHFEADCRANGDRFCGFSSWQTLLTIA
jgi:hypothetical protein